jgi:hypothetical protein
MNTKDFYTQINLDLSDIDTDSLELKYHHGFLYGTGTFDVYHPTLDFLELFKSKLQEPVRSIVRNVRVVLVSGGELVPHCDNPGPVRLNFYLATNTDVTKFWSLKPEKFALPPVNNNTNPIYQLDDLTYECKFLAEQHSCYLLNTGRIHSVEMPNKNSVRKILQVTFDQGLDYFTVLEKFLESNLIKNEE